MFIVGIDIAKRTHVASIINMDGEQVGKTFKFSNTKEGFECLIGKLNARSSNLSDFHIGMESTGQYWLCVYTHLLELGYKVNVLNPIQSDALRGLFIRKTKTDQKDDE